VVTAAYILRAIGDVFLGDYDEHKWHDMRPLLAIDKFTLAVFSLCLIVIGVFPAVIAPIVEAGVAPVVARLEIAQQTSHMVTIFDSVQTARPTSFIGWEAPK
jgi:NADH:ubiquinone oxidoreductase subunit 4 (subunit M)